MKKFLFSMALLLTLGMLTSIQAQDDCNCPPGQEPGTDIVVNGDFAAGNTGFTSDLPAPTANCDIGSYIVGHEARDLCTGWPDDLWDHTEMNSTGEYLIIDGWRTDPGTSNRVWAQPLTLSGGVQYEFRFWWLPTFSNDPTDANTTLEVFVNGSSISGHIDPIESTDWVQLCFPFRVEQDGVYRSSIRQVDNFNWFGHDYGIDDITIRPCEDIPPPVCECPNGTRIGGELLDNPDFEAGDVGFNTDLPLRAFNCDVGSYLVGHQATDMCSNFPPNLFDNTIGTIAGHYLIVDGFNTNPGGNNSLWNQDVNVQNGTQYEFRFWWLPTFGNGNGNSTLQVTVDGNDISGNIVNVNGARWQEFCYPFTATASASVNISINQIIGFQTVGHDFGIDDVSLKGCLRPCRDCPPGTEPAQIADNGDFELGDTGFSSDLPLQTSNCDIGSYLVAHEAQDKCTSWSPNLFDHTFGTAQGHYLVVDGWRNDPGVNNRVWYQDVPVTAGLQYQFSFWWRPTLGAASSASTSLEVIANGFSLSGTIDPIMTNEWVELCYVWTANVSGNVEISINQVDDFNWFSFDYGLDDILFYNRCDEIIVPDPCEVYSKWEYRVNQETCEVSFRDLSYGGGSTTVVGWEWDFGDGTTSTDQHPTHFFPGPGVYEVCLTVWGINDDGECCSDTYCFEVKVECEARDCKINVDYFKFSSVREGSCTYDLSVGVTANRPIIGYFWNFGDGTTGSGANVTHTFPGSGLYYVCVTIVADDNGRCCSETVCKYIYVQCEGEGSGPRPDGDVAECKVGAKFDVTQNFNCSFNFIDFSASGVGTTIIGYSWDFGDGTTSTDQNPVHFYNNTGGYIVCLTVYGVNKRGECCVDTYCRELYNGCEPQDCRVRIEDITTLYSIVGCTVKMNAVYSSTAPIVGTYWDFGDGTTGNDDCPLHTFPRSGTYNVCVTLVASNRTGCCTDTYCEKVSVNCPDDNADSRSNRVVQGTHMTLSPNPATNLVRVEITTNSSTYELAVVNIQGQIVHLDKGEKATGATTLELNAKALAPGTYFVRLITDDQLTTEKLIIQ